MAAQDKTVKITIAVDDAAAAKAKRSIVEITQEVDRLVKATQSLGGFLGGLGGTRVGTKAGAPGTGSATQMQHGQGALGGVTSAIAGGAQAGAQQIRKTADAANASFKSMKDNFKGLVDAQDREVRRMEGIWGRFKRAIGGIGSSGGGGGLGGGASGTVAGGGAAPGVSNPPVAAPPGRRGGGAGGAGNGGWLPGGQNGVLAGVANQIGIPTGALLAAGAVTMGTKIGTSVVSAAFNNQMANIGGALESPFGRFDARAALGSIMGGNTQGLRHGDIARIHAMKALASDPATKELLGQDNAIEVRRQKEHATSFVDNFAKNGVGGAFSWLGGKVGSGLGTAGDWLGDRLGGGFSSFGGTKAVGMGNANAQQIEQDLARQKEFALQAERQQRLLEAKMREDPMFNERMNNVFARSGSDSSMMRGLGMSGRDVKIATDLKGNPVYSSASAIMRGRAESEGRDVGEYVSAFSSLQQQAGRGFAGRYHGILGPQTGGLYNAAGIQGVGAQFGGYGQLLGQAGRSGIQSMIGRGGVDVTAGANTAQLGLQSMQQPGFMGGMAGTGGSGLMETLLTAVNSGSIGGDMFNAARLSGGMAQREREASGTRDQLNKAMNLSAAMKAAPMAPWTIRNSLTSMTDASLMDIIHHPENMPKMLLDNGISYEMVEKYYNAKNASGLARFGRSKVYGTGEQRSVVEQYAKFGGIGFLKGKSPEEIDKSINLLSMADAGAGGNAADLRMKYRMEAAKAGVLGRPGGRGAGDVLAKGTVIDTANVTKGIQLGVEGQQEHAESGGYKEDIAGLPEAQAQGEIHRRQGQKGFQAGAGAGAAIQGVTAALENFVAALKDMNAGSGRPGARK